MPKIWFRASKQAYYLQIDRTRQLRLGRTRTEADTAYRQWLLAEGGSLPEPSRQALTVAEIAQEFLDDAQANTKPKSYEFYRYFVAPFVERFGSTPAATFQPIAFRRWLDEHKGWKGARRSAVIAIRRLFNFAVKNRLIPQNPVLPVAKPAKRKRKRILDSAERKLLMANIRGRQFREYCFALLHTGARPMEVAAVRADQVSKDGACWLLDEHKTEGTGEPRIIYLTPPMRKLTQKLIREQPVGPLFRSGIADEAGVKKPWTLNSIRCRFKRLRDKEPRLVGVTAYVLRHSFTTQALLNGVPVPVVAALLGHKSIKMVDEHYSHVEQSAAAMHAGAARATARG